ncbi:MAG TPA: twin-arginine translocation pathway signal protein [Kiloniellaceae bacterium]|nr:twin-arginine translocation pathway signal protein [Kiloniellaceae bacterium]
MHRRLQRTLAILFVAVMAFGLGGGQALAEKAATIEQNSREALELLLNSSAGAKALSNNAEGILVFPKIVKGGLILGGQYGEGALFKNDAVSGYCSTAAASFGLQAGIQTFGYAVFFLDEASLTYLDNSDGWEIGTTPNAVVVDSGASAALSTTTTQEGIYVFFFDQKGLMAGLTIEGTKITTIDPE